MKSYFIILIGVIVFTSCNQEESVIDASGVFEATEIIVSSEANGKILAMTVRDGDKVSLGQILCEVDSLQLKLSLEQLVANKDALLASRPEIEAQIDATKQEIAKQEFEKKRIEKLLAGDVATQKQLDDIESMLSILKARLRSQKSTLNTSIRSINAQTKAIDVQMKQVQDQINKCIIRSPLTGTVLLKYAEAGEMTGVGKPLYKIADIDNMILRAYVTADQLAQLKIGQVTTVYGEFGTSELKEYKGTISWISSKSEFTPKTIQTQDERANLVYAVKVAVPNDGLLKIGMYGGFAF
jgi:HlyD family secretion protein